MKKVHVLTIGPVGKTRLNLKAVNKEQSRVIGF